MNETEIEAVELTAMQQMRIAALNAAIAMGKTNPREACKLADHLMDWIKFGDAPVPPKGEIW